MSAEEYVADLNVEFMKIEKVIYIYNLYIYFACLGVCLSVCLYPINVKTAEPIGTKFCVGVGHHVTPGKVYE